MITEFIMVGNNNPLTFNVDMVVLQFNNRVFLCTDGHAVLSYRQLIVDNWKVVPSDSSDIRINDIRISIYNGVIHV